MLKNILRTHYVLLSIIVILGYWLLVVFSQPSYFSNNVFPDGVKIVRDDYDRSVYLDRAQWFVQHKIPYKDVFSEYPQFVTYFFAFPAVFTRDTLLYIDVFSLLMIFFFVALVFVTLELLKLFEKPYHYILILLLPSFLYHTLNRFDIIPALFVSLALLLYLKNRHLLSASALVIGFFIKWYPILLLPLLLSQLWLKNRKLFYKISLFSVASIGTVFLWSYVWSGNAIFIPYFWHLTKGFYYESIYYLFDLLINNLHLGISFPTSLFAIGIQLATLLVPFLSFFKPKLLTKQQILNAILFIILIFIFFNSGRAPQFNLWFVPLYILVIRNRTGVILLIAFDLLNYLFYPIGAGMSTGTLGYVNDLLSVCKNIFFLGLFYYLLVGATDIKHK